MLEISLIHYWHLPAGAYLYFWFRMLINKNYFKHSLPFYPGYTSILLNDADEALVCCSVSNIGRESAESAEGISFFRKKETDYLNGKSSPLIRGIKSE